MSEGERRSRFNISGLIDDALIAFGNRRHANCPEEASSKQPPPIYPDTADTPNAPAIGQGIRMSYGRFFPGR